MFRRGCADGGRYVAIARTCAVAPAASLLPYCLGTMTYLEIALADLIALSLPLWLFIEEIANERAREQTAIAIRDERRRVAASREAVARKAVLKRAS